MRAAAARWPITAVAAPTRTTRARSPCAIAVRRTRCETTYCEASQDCRLHERAFGPVRRERARANSSAYYAAIPLRDGNRNRALLGRQRGSYAIHMRAMGDLLRWFTSARA